MSQAPLLYVLDTSALLTLIEDEAGADHVQELLEKAKHGEVMLLVSFMSFVEVYYISLQERGQAEAQERVKFSGVPARAACGIKRKPWDAGGRVQSRSPSVR